MLSNKQVSKPTNPLKLKLKLTVNHLYILEPKKNYCFDHSHFMSTVTADQVYLQVNYTRYSIENGTPGLKAEIGTTLNGMSKKGLL